MAILSTCDPDTVSDSWKVQVTRTRMPKTVSLMRTLADTRPPITKTLIAGSSSQYGATNCQGAIASRLLANVATPF
jgi:hypothetical protein